MSLMLAITWPRSTRPSRRRYPTIGRQFQTVTSLSWVITAYLLASTAVTPVFGTLSDISGRTVVIAGFDLSFFVGSVLCALAPQHAGADPRARPAGASAAAASCRWCRR